MKRAAQGQQGVSMLFALLALAVLMLGALALVRSVDSSSLALGNLGFKRDATAASFVAADIAIDSYLKTRSSGSALDDNDPANGYYATSLDNLDPTGRLTSASHKMALVDWKRNGCTDVASGTYSTCNFGPSAAVDVKIDGKTIATVQYLITRLCQTTGAHDAPTNSCLRPVKSISTGSYNKDSVSSANASRFSAAAGGPYYRVITRTEGARGTVSYTETLVHF